MRLVYCAGCLQQPLFYKATQKSIAFEEGCTFCNRNVCVEFSDISLLLNGQSYLSVVLVDSFPVMDIFARQLMKHNYMCYISIPMV